MELPKRPKEINPYYNTKELVCGKKSFMITEKDRNQVLVPPGFANGHYALTDCMFHYNLFYKDGYVDADEQGVVKWNEGSIELENHVQISISDNGMVLHF